VVVALVAGEFKAVTADLMAHVRAGGASAAAGPALLYLAVEAAVARVVVAIVAVVR
jgi:hypothetical protein